MLRQRKTLARLFEELGTLQGFDRIHEYSTGPDPASERAYAIRQLRRKQILDEIAKLRTPESEPGKRAWVGSAVVFAYAVGYATLYYLLR